MPNFRKAEVGPAPIHISKLPFRERRGLLCLEYFIADTGCRDIYPDDIEGLPQAFQGARAFLQAHVADPSLRRLLEYHYSIDRYTMDDPPRRRPSFNTVARRIGFNHIDPWEVTQQAIKKLRKNRIRQEVQEPGSKVI